MDRSAARIESIRGEGPDQVAAADLPERRWDVLVVGAGPAGATAALHLVRRGYGVLLAEREAFPRDKTCGDNLLSDATAALARLGLLDEVRSVGHRLRHGSLFSPAGVEVALPGDYLTVRRRTLDAILAGRAAAEGVTFCLGGVRALRSEDGRETVAALADRPHLVRARAVVFAAGAGAVPPVTGASTAPPPAPTRAVALRCYVRSSTDLDRMIVAYRRPLLPGYAWIFPLGGGEYNVGCGVFARGRSARPANLAEALHHFADSFPLAKELFRRAESLPRPCGARLRYGLRGDPLPAGGSIFVAGEALGRTYPLTGEGIGKAMETGELAAEAAHEALTAGPECGRRRYGEAIAALRERYRAYDRAARWLSHAPVGDFLASRARRSPYLRGAAARILRDEADPSEIFSWRGVLRSFFG